MNTKSITIKYHHEKSSGEMTLVLDHFFPTTLKDWRIIGPLLDRFGTDDDIKAVREYLNQLSEDCANEMREISSEYVNTSPGSNRFKKCELDFKDNEKLKKKADKNIEYLDRFMKHRR